MPNHCTTHMQVDGPAKDIEAFKLAIRGATLPPDEYYDHEREMYIDFDKIIPEPDMVKASTMVPITLAPNGKHYPPLNWYDWRCENWGTKWNAYFQEVTYASETEYHIQFDTAWNPPYPIIKALRKQWPTLDFGGGGFVECEEGEFDLDDMGFQP